MHIALRGTFMHPFNSGLTILMALACSAPAWAAPATSPNNLGLSGYSQLQLESSALDAWNIGSMVVTGEQSDLQVIGNSGEYKALTMDTYVVSITYDDQTQELLGVSIAGGLRLEAPTVAGVSVGGWVSMRDLYIDFPQQRIQGTITGQSLNGVEVNYTGTLFTIPSVTFNPESWQPRLHQLQLTGIELQADALEAISTALGAQFLLQLALNASTENYGVLSINLFHNSLATPLTPAILPPSMAMAVPESSTWILMGLGLCGLMLTSRRKSVSTAH